MVSMRTYGFGVMGAAVGVVGVVVCANSEGPVSESNEPQTSKQVKIALGRRFMNEAYLGDRNAAVSAMAVGSADVLDTVLRLLSLRRATEQPLGPRFLNESVLEAFAAVQQAHVALAGAVTAWDAADAWSRDGALNASAWLRNKLGISSPTAHTILNFACKTSIFAPTVRDAVMDRVAEAERLVARGDLTPELTGIDRELLASTLQRLRHLLSAQNPTEQLLHGEPHPGNIINTANGPVFVDLETCCRGPIEFDLAPRSPGRKRAL